jgi:hypothetical protein
LHYGYNNSKIGKAGYIDASLQRNERRRHATEVLV